MSRKRISEDPELREALDYLTGGRTLEDLIKERYRRALARDQQRARRRERLRRLTFGLLGR
jgi:hypothetical protein